MTVNISAYCGDASSMATSMSSVYIGKTSMRCAVSVIIPSRSQRPRSSYTGSEDCQGLRTNSLQLYGTIIGGLPHLQQLLSMGAPLGYSPKLPSLHVVLPTHTHTRARAHARTHARTRARTRTHTHTHIPACTCHPAGCQGVPVQLVFCP